MGSWSAPGQVVQRKGESEADDKDGTNLIGFNATSSGELHRPPPQAKLVLPIQRYDEAQSIMSLLRQGKVTSLRAVSQYSGKLAVPRLTRSFSSSASFSADEASPKTTPQDAPAALAERSSITRKETPSEAMARHQPDYNATVDHGTS